MDSEFDLDVKRVHKLETYLAQWNVDWFRYNTVVKILSDLQVYSVCCKIHVAQVVKAIWKVLKSWTKSQSNLLIFHVQITHIHKNTKLSTLFNCFRQIYIHAPGLK